MQVLQAANITSTFLFSNLDPSARKIAVGKFSNKVVQCLVVTDIAARGIDIPDVKVVINYHFPATPKLFVHRVGRCARAGRSGIAYTMTTKEDVAYMLDLHLFLGKPFDPTQLGRVPAGLLEENHALILEWHKEKTDIVGGRLNTKDGIFIFYCNFREAWKASAIMLMESI